MDTQKRNEWGDHAATRIQALNSQRRPSSIRTLRLALTNSAGRKGMSQGEFGELIGFPKKGAQARVSILENGLAPSADVIAKMEEIARANSIDWRFEQ